MLLRSIKYTPSSYRINKIFRNISFVPASAPPSRKDYEHLLSFLTEYDKIAVLSGAGLSTESGIPDYRSEQVGLYARTNHKPIQYIEFLKSNYARRRYWARNFIGWPRFSNMQPNSNHYSINCLEKIGKVSTIITQNVDSLHSKAGSKDVIELHGSSYKVICLNCNNHLSRYEFQDILCNLNPNMEAETKMIRPDGDVEISEDKINSFIVPDCNECGGILKPYVVFFGDNVPRQRVERVNSEISNSSALLVLGTSLSTFSAYRIILLAKEQNKKIFLINIGPTRADKDINIKISAKCGDILPEVVRNLNL